MTRSPLLWIFLGEPGWPTLPPLRRCVQIPNFLFYSKYLKVLVHTSNDKKMRNELILLNSPLNLNHLKLLGYRSTKFHLFRFYQFGKYSEIAMLFISRCCNVRTRPSTWWLACQVLGRPRILSSWPGIFSESRYFLQTKKIIDTGNHAIFKGNAHN